MKTRILSIIAILAMSFAVNAQRNLNLKPKAGPAPKVKLGKAKKFKLNNGLQVIMVENHKLPRASASLTIDNKPVIEGEKAGVSAIMGSMLGNGTTKMPKDTFNERVDYLGATISINSDGAYASSLKKYFPEILEMLADGVKNPVFLQEEFDKEIQQTLEGIKSNEKSVTAIAGRVENALVYGKSHPYGEFITKKSIKGITLKDVKVNYQSFYKPNNAYLVIAGDINPSKIKKLVKELFADWKSAASIPTATFSKPVNPGVTEVNFIDVHNAVQSEVVVANNINLTLGDKDYYAALLANNILGGSGTARLFMNLREDKGYTYGSYSRVSQNRYAGKFKAFAKVRNTVTDSSMVQIMKEIDAIKNTKVTAEELKNAKASYIGNFVMNVQKPRTAANYALNIARYNLPKDFYEKYLENINSVTLEDVQSAANKYFLNNNARVIITGKASDVLENLEKTSKYKINYFDTYANPTKKPEVKIEIPAGVSATTVIDSYFKAIGGLAKAAAVKTLLVNSTTSMQGMTLNLETKYATPNKSSVVVSMGGNAMQKVKFDGTQGYQEARGQKMPITGEALTEVKNSRAPFSDFGYKKGKLVRIEAVNGEKMYVIKSGKKEIFYIVKTGLKAKEVTFAKGPKGEIQVPVEYTDYKEVNGIKFPHTMIQTMGPMKMNFKVKEVKINSGVTDADFK